MSEKIFPPTKLACIDLDSVVGPVHGQVKRPRINVNTAPKTQTKHQAVQQLLQPDLPIPNLEVLTLRHAFWTRDG